VTALGTLTCCPRPKAATVKRLLLLLLLFLPSPAFTQDKLEDHWYSLLLEGKTVGFLHQTTWRSPEGLIRSEIEQTMVIHRFGVPFSMTQTDVWTEEKSGALVSVSSQLDMNGSGRLVEARPEEEVLWVRIRSGAEVDELLLPIEDEPRGPYSIDREIAAGILDSSGTGQIDYRLFSPETMKIEEFRLRVIGTGELADSLGRTHRGILVEERTTGLPGVVTTEVYDGEARFLYSKTPVGLELEILRLERDPGAEAPASEQGLSGSGEPAQEVAAVFDVASLTVPVKGLGDVRLDGTQALTLLFRGPGAAILHEAVLSAEEDLASFEEAGDAALRIVSIHENDRGEVDELVLELTNRPAEVQRVDCPPESLPPEVKGYLDGGFHLDLKDPRLAELLERCRQAEEGGQQRGSDVLCLEGLVDRYIVNKSLAYGFAGLEEVLSKKAGDCTEHALLLVALLRKAGLPSRIAYGLILTEFGFIGHAWVELYTERRWHWLDPSFPGGRPYGLKIRLGVIDPAQPLWASLSLSLLQVMGNVEAEIVGRQPR
jgi:transglutaminase-like putative cysteine protease